VAVVGKLVPAYGATRIGGLDPGQSAMVAALVNTRGLTELIALNVALAAGIINTELFTVLVLMALITTLMTGPLLSVIGRKMDVLDIRSTQIKTHIKSYSRRSLPEFMLPGEKGGRYP
jgi:Kef-type K+ transport system membrane component KefB